MIVRASSYSQDFGILEKNNNKKNNHPLILPNKDSIMRGMFLKCPRWLERLRLPTRSS